MSLPNITVQIAKAPMPAAISRRHASAARYQKGKIESFIAGVPSLKSHAQARSGKES
jgi:hypothetical protein